MNAFPFPRRDRRTRRRGFSLVELMVVVLIIAILMSLTVAGARHFMTKAFESKTRQHLKTIELALERYHEANSEYPKSTKGSKELYQALTGDTDMDGRISSDQERQSGNYLPELLVPGDGKSLQGWIEVRGKERRIIDAFGEELQYRMPGEKNAAYDLWSYGTDKKKQSANEAKWIKNW